MKLKQGISILKQGILTRQYRFKKVFALSLLSAIADEQKPIQFVFVDVENYQSPLPPSFVDGRTTFTFASAAQEGLEKKMLRIAPLPFANESFVHLHRVPTGPDAADVDLIMLCSQLRLIAGGRQNDRWIVMSNDNLFQSLETGMKDAGAEVHLVRSSGPQARAKQKFSAEQKQKAKQKQ